MLLSLLVHGGLFFFGGGLGITLHAPCPAYSKLSKLLPHDLLNMHHAVQVVDRLDAYGDELSE